MKHRTNKKYKKLRKTRKFRKTIKNRRLKKNHKKTHKKGGMFKRALAALTTGFLLLGSTILPSATAGGDKYIIAVCAGNTCRSTMAQEQLISILGTESYNIFSRGVNVRASGSAMAPLSEAFSIATCEGDQECITRVKEHRSTQFDCQEVVKILRANSLATFLIIPMDDDVADSIEKLLTLCDMTAEERSRVSVGFCDAKSANIQDPFWDKNQPTEGNAYSNAGNKIYHSFYEAFGTECRLNEWKDATDKYGSPMISNKPYQTVWPGYIPDRVQDMYDKKP